MKKSIVAFSIIMGFIIFGCGVDGMKATAAEADGECYKLIATENLFRPPIFP